MKSRRGFGKRCLRNSLFFFLNDPPPTEFYTLPLPDALPIPHPFRGKRSRLTGTDVQFLGVEHDRPRPPCRGRFETAQPAVKAEINLSAGVAGAFVWPRV